MNRIAIATLHLMNNDWKLRNAKKVDTYDGCYLSYFNDVRLINRDIVDELVNDGYIVNIDSKNEYYGDYVITDKALQYIQNVA